MKLTDERLIEFITKKFDGCAFDLEKFLNPSYGDFRDINKLKNLSLAAERLKQAISENKKILIYGDYDCDGICATTILLLHLRSLGAHVDVFIPNRFDNGYGISVDAIEEIMAEFSPDVIVTVDLGITAVEEVEILKNEGVEVIVTDHHLPLAEIPDCVVVDPKICVHEYGFDGLCGAGVALKLVEAMSDIETAKKYLDICALATVGDIVPLVDENRAIAALGIQKINAGDCQKSIKFMLSKLGITKVNSTDISFKIVPRLNACGRMDSAIKVVEFLTETDNRKLEEKFNEIESDNSHRLAAIEDGIQKIRRELDRVDCSLPSILVRGNFHEGVIGILASKISHEHLKPSIIFTETDEGTLKGSGRSVGNINIHEIISQMDDLLLNFGGHKLAVGLEILPENFDIFCQRFNEMLAEKVSEEADISAKKFDILIGENDLSEKFFAQLELLEPFGCENEKPILGLVQNEMIVTPMNGRTFSHYRCFTKKNIAITAFGAYKFVDILRSKSQKIIVLDMQQDEYAGKQTLKFILNDVIPEKIDFDGFLSENIVSSLYNKYYSIFEGKSEQNYHLFSDVKQVLGELFKSNFGTLLVVSNNDDLAAIEGLGLEKLYTAKPLKNARNAVLVCPNQVVRTADVKGYKNIIFLHKFFDQEHSHFSFALNVFEPEKTVPLPVSLNREREVLAQIYKLIVSAQNIKANDELEYAKKLSLISPFSAEQIMFAMIVFMELNFIEFDAITNSLRVLSAKKMELTKSKFYSEVGNYGKD